MSCADYLSSPPSTFAHRGLVNATRSWRKAAQLLFFSFSTTFTSFSVPHHNPDFLRWLSRAGGTAGWEGGRRVWARSTGAAIPVSLSLSVYPRNLGKTKTVSGWDEKVLPVQQVCTEGGELSEDAIFSCTLLYSVTDWNHKVKPNTLDVVFVFQVLSCNGQQRLFKNRRSPSLNTFRVVLVFIFLEQHLSARGATGHWNVRLQWHWVYF